MNLEEEFAQHRGAFVVRCYRFLGSLHDAEDAVQETYLRAWRGQAGFEQRASVKTWLYRIATNVCFNSMHHSSRRLVPSAISAQRWALSLAPHRSILVALDTLVVASAPLSIRREAGANLEHLEGTVKAHRLALAALRMPRVAVGDRVVSRQWTLVTGLAAFTLTSVGCAFVPTIVPLVLAPMAQGVDAAVITPVAIRRHHAIPRHT